MDSTPKHGGKRTGAGRKKIDDEPSVTVSFRATPRQRDKFKRMGGGKWIRRKIDEEQEQNK